MCFALKAKEELILTNNIVMMWPFQIVSFWVVFSFFFAIVLACHSPTTDVLVVKVVKALKAGKLDVLMSGLLVFLEGA